MNYYFEDFTEENYRRLLHMAKGINKFRDYQEAYNAEGGIIWRHDIDYSVHRAYSLAKIEAEEGIKANYFVHFHSELYNVLEIDIIEKIREISKMGHNVGVHFEPGFYGINITDKEELEAKLTFEKELLEKLLEKKVNAFSFHNPEVGGEWYLYSDLRVAGCFNAYSDYYRGNFEYCSDSNGYWRYKRLEDVLTNPSNKNLHILLHPCWWQAEGMAPYSRIKRCVYGRAERNIQNYCSLLSQMGRENVQ